MSRCHAEQDGFIYGALKIAVGVFIGVLAALFAYELIMVMRLEGRLTTVFSKPVVRFSGSGISSVSTPYRVDIAVPKPPVGEIQWSDDPESKLTIRR